MRNDCVFKDNAKSACTFPKVLQVCHLCLCYLKNGGNLDNNLKYINYIYYKKNSYTSIAVSCISLAVALCSLYIVIYKWVVAGK